MAIRLTFVTAASVAVLAAVLSWYFSDEEQCHLTFKLKRRKPEQVVLGLRAQEDPWPAKLGNPARTSRTNRTGPRDILEPRWSFFSPGLAYSSPLVDKSGNIYIPYTFGMVVCLDPNGNIRWTYKTRADSASNAMMADGVLFVNDAASFAYALDTKTGRERWVKQFGSRGSAGNEAVTVGEGLAIFHWCLGEGGSWTAESEFVALDQLDGAEVWRAKVAAPFFNVIMAFADGGASLVYTDMDGGTHKMETKTGRPIWTAPGFPFALTPEMGWFGGDNGAPRTHSGLALVDVPRGVVYGGGNAARHTGRVRALRLETGEEIWSRDVDKMLGNNGALAEVDGVPTLVFGTGHTCQHPIPEAKPPFRGTVYGLHAETGALLWSFEVEPWNGVFSAGSVFNPRCPLMNMPDAFNAPTIDGNGTVYIGWHGGIIYALDARSGALISKFQAGEGPQANFAIGPSGELIAVGARWLHSFWP